MVGCKCTCYSCPDKMKLNVFFFFFQNRTQVADHLLALIASLSWPVQVFLFLSNGDEFAVMSRPLASTNTERNDDTTHV
jgi:hypothetical protein